jgi:hypothetical protein
VGSLQVLLKIIHSFTVPVNAGVKCRGNSLFFLFVTKQEEGQISIALTGIAG